MLFVNFAMLTKELFAGDVGRKLFQSQKKNFEAKKLFRFGREKVLRAGLNAVEACLQYQRINEGALGFDSHV